MTNSPPIQDAIHTQSDGLLTLRVKVVPGASRSRVVGMLGDRLKLAVAAPPEQGKANKAVCKLLADVLGVSLRDVAVTAGQSQPLKTLTISGMDADRAVVALSKCLGP